MKTKVIKGFDCVEMMHHAGEIIRKRTEGMTLDEEIQYWRRRNKEFLKEHAKLRRRNLAGARKSG